MAQGLHMNITYLAGLYNVWFTSDGVELTRVPEGCPPVTAENWIRLDQASCVRGTSMSTLVVTPVMRAVSYQQIFPASSPLVGIDWSSVGCDCGAEKHGWTHDFSCPKHFSKT